MQQKRLLIALVVSSVILFLWSYFYPPPRVQNQNSNATASPGASATATPIASSEGQPAQLASLATPNVSSAPQRFVTVKTPLYDAKFDTLGAEPVSWTIKANKNRTKNNQKEPIYSVAGKKSEKKP